MQPYSNDLRRRVIEAIQKNEETQQDIAEHFSVSTSFVEKLWNRFLKTGNYEALPHRGGRTRLLADSEALIRQLVIEQPDLTLIELSEKVAAETVTAPVSEAVMCLELQRLELPRKKSRFTPANKTASASKPSESNIEKKSVK